MSVALLFSGQGHQHAAQLPWLRDDELVRDACAQLGVSDWRIALADPVWASINRHAQVLITATSLAAWRQLAERLASSNAAPVAVAGYSVGELAAFSAAGVMSASAAIALAEQRAACMDAAAQDHPGGLMGVSGLIVEDGWPTQHGVHLAIRSAPDSVVLGGEPSALASAEVSALAQGARVTRLSIAVASHTPLMAAAREGFAQALGPVDVSAPRVPLFCNVGGRVWRPDQAREVLSRQLSTTVAWDRCMDDVAARAPSCVVEIGGGQALARLWQQRHPHIPARAGDEFRTLDGLAAWVAQMSAA